MGYIKKRTEEQPFHFEKMPFRFGKMDIYWGNKTGSSGISNEMAIIVKW